ncbi:MAG TPA: hypothetical protein VEL07_05230 [Planctomycetota bacterium]|nr:hypothetical protein [Planctomycetota bacterium]
MKRARRAAVWLLALVCAVALIGWNVGRFHGAEARIRTKNLDFLPSPTVARAMALGQASTAAKLRWIDSFAYFQLQLDKRDDRVSGSGSSGGFQRLYDMLIGLDPLFEPFYEHASLCTSGVLEQHHLALGYLLRGTMEKPHSTSLWRNAAAMLHAQFQYSERRPDLFDDFLKQWAEHELDPDQRQAVWIWQANLARQKFAGLAQLPQWFERLRASSPRTPMGDYIEDVVREQLARYGVNELQALADATSARRLAAPVTLGEILDPAAIQARYPQGVPEFSPVVPLPGGFATLGDPWGYPYALVDGKVVSPGWERVRYEQRLAALNHYFETRRSSGEEIPERVADLPGAGIELPPPPLGASVRLDDGRLVAEWTPPPQTPYDVRMLAQADINEQRAMLRAGPRVPPR